MRHGMPRDEGRPMCVSHAHACESQAVASAQQGAPCRYTWAVAQPASRQEALHQAGPGLVQEGSMHSSGISNASRHQRLHVLQQPPHPPPDTRLSAAAAGAQPRGSEDEPIQSTRGPLTSRPSCQEAKDEPAPRAEPPPAGPHRPSSCGRGAGCKAGQTCRLQQRQPHRPHLPVPQGAAPASAARHALHLARPLLLQGRAEGAWRSWRVLGRAPSQVEGVPLCVRCLGCLSSPCDRPVALLSDFSSVRLHECLVRTCKKDLSQLLRPQWLRGT